MGKNTWSFFAAIFEIFCQRMYFMSLFYHRTVFNHPVVQKLLHDVQLTASIRNSILSLKSIPHLFASRETDICVQKIFSKHAYETASEEVIESFESTLLLWSVLTRIPLCQIHHAHYRKPQYSPFTPTLVIGTSKWWWFD